MSHELLLEGTLGVDARRAASKIRDHLLANPATWLSEIGRVAVLSCATRLAIDVRATSIVVEWNGDPIAVDVIESFGRHLLADDADVPKKRKKKNERAVRDRRPELLTLAVFAALGDVGKAVDITLAVETSAADKGSPAAAKTRRLTRLELEGALDGEKGRARDLARADAFSLLEDATGALVIDLGSTFGAVRHWMGLGAAPAALTELSARLGSGLSITVDGKPLERMAPDAVLSLDLVSIGDVQLRLDLLAEPFREPRMIFYELGFEVARAPMLEPSFDGAPLRLVVSAAQLPTNASRSQVDEDLSDKVRRAAIGALHALVERLRHAIVSALERGDRATQDLLERISGHIAFAISRAPDDSPVRKALSPVLEWPLLRDAVGRPLSVRDAQLRAGGFEITGREQKEPLPVELAPMVTDVIWRRGVSAERVFHLRDYDLIAEDVEAGLARKRHLAEHPVAFEPPARETARWRYQNVEPEGMEWAIALDVDSTGPCLARVFVGDDLIETIEVEHKSPFYRFDAAVRWPGVVVPVRTMDRMQVGYGSGRMRGKLDSVVEQCLLRTLREGDVAKPGVVRWLALRLVGASSDSVPLSFIPMWELASGGLEKGSALRDSAAKRGHLYVMERPFVAGERAPGEPVVVVPVAERQVLGDVVGQKLVDYTPFAAAPPATPLGVERYFAAQGLAVHAFLWREFLLAVTPAERGRHISMHRGIVLEECELEGDRGMLVVSDGEKAMAKCSPGYADMHRAAWRMMIDWLATDPEKMAGSLDAPGVRDALIQKMSFIVTKNAESKIAPDQWPVFRLRTPRGERPASAAEIVAHFEDDSLPALGPEEPHDPRVDCVVGSKTEIGLIERITKRKSMRPMPSITGGAPRNPSSATGDPAGGDILAAIRDVMPGATPAPTVEPAPRKDEATTPEAADVPLVGGGEEPAAPSDPRPTPPNPPTPSGHRWPAPEVVHVDPDDILGPIRYLMTDAKTKPALDTQQKKPATPPRPPIVSPLMAAPPAPLGPAPSRPPSRAPSRPPEGAWDRLVGLFKKPLLDVPDDHPLASMARRVSQNLYVERLELRFADASDDAVRFERQTTTLVVNPEHPTVRVLIESGDVVPLVAAAFSEINRELKTVSDDEERRALGRLLLDPPARAS